MKHFIVILISISLVTSHSWLSCSDYDLSNPEDAKVYNPSKCSGWGRGWAKTCQNTNNQFGLDCGYNHGGASPVCSTRINPGNYSTEYSAVSHMATYYPGQQICLAWPAKNHVAAKCVNPNIPDSGTKIYMSAANPKADPANLDALKTSPYTLVKDFGKNTGADAMIGFQNCPLFCQNNDKALCTGCFTVPTTVEPGSVYTFFWAWAFNSPQDTFTNCWEVNIVADPAAANSAVTFFSLSVLFTIVLLF
eukprot:TRINITY_DN4516_c0_g1_i1.p1 TRINITY_DN4516_c0_g1~~TRINITY_DN4516_c0_g1_i1.p1  ORF type:complete len:268 (-),score=59.42 TRINITY_DN4516_c0_g1_i1:41-787(-)